MREAHVLLLYLPASLFGWLCRPFCNVIEFCVSWISNANKGDIQVSCCHLNTRRDELDCALKMKCCFCIHRRRVFSSFYSKVGAKYCFESSHKSRKWLFMRYWNTLLCVEIYMSFNASFCLDLPVQMPFNTRCNKLSDFGNT